VIARKHPEWIRVRAPTGDAVARTRAIVRDFRLHTVCEEAQCPNVGECWAHDTATFMLLGDTCTRNCGFCAVRHGRPLVVDCWSYLAGRKSLPEVVAGALWTTRIAESIVEQVAAAA